MNVPLSYIQIVKHSISALMVKLQFLMKMELLHLVLMTQDYTLGSEDKIFSIQNLMKKMNGLNQ